MKKKFLIPISLFILFTILLSSCVSTKKYQEILSKNNKCEEDIGFLKGENQKLTSKTNEQEAIIQRYEQEIKQLAFDTTSLGKHKRTLASNYNQLSSTYETLLRQFKNLLAGNKSETEKILTELEVAQTNIQKKEDELKMKQQSLEEISLQLNEAKLEMEATKTKLINLQQVLEEKDAIVKELKNKVSNALLGFENQGLTVYEKNSKVYISLEESLVFASGSIKVQAKGSEALIKLAKILENNPDINIMIEGHTDDVPYISSGQIQDNWDLSVQRATAIVRILIKNSNIDPKRFTTSGRSKYVPLDSADTKEARSKNRRTEIILTPKLDELFRIIESN